MLSYLRFLAVLMLLVTSPKSMLCATDDQEAQLEQGAHMAEQIHHHSSEKGCKRFSTNIKELTKLSIYQAPLLRWIFSLSPKTSPHHHTDETLKHGIKMTVMNTCVMAGMIGFHFVIKTHGNHMSPCHTSELGGSYDGKMMCQDIDGSRHVEPFAGNCSIPDGVNGLDHHFLNCSWHANGGHHGDHSRVLMDEHCDMTSTGEQIGRLFLSMEIGMQAGHIAALWINKLIVDEIF